MKVGEEVTERWLRDKELWDGTFEQLDEDMRSGRVDADNLSKGWRDFVTDYMDAQVCLVPSSVIEYGNARAAAKDPFSRSFMRDEDAPKFVLEGNAVSQMYNCSLEEGTDWGWATLPDGRLAIINFDLFGDPARHNKELDRAVLHVWDSSGDRFDYSLPAVVDRVRLRVIQEARDEYDDRMEDSLRRQNRKLEALASPDGALLEKYGIRPDDGPDDAIHAVQRYVKQHPGAGAHINELRSRADDLLKETVTRANDDQGTLLAEFLASASPGGDETQASEIYELIGRGLLSMPK